MEATTSFICLSELHEEFEQERAIYNFLHRLCLGNYLLDEAFLNGNNSIVHDLGRVIIEQAMYY